MRQISEASQRKLEQCEAPGGRAVLKAYRDGGGVPTIGFGHIKGVVMGQQCTEGQARKWLAEDLDESEVAVNKLVKVPLTQLQFDALVIFVFNIGVAAFKGSTLLRLLNQGRYDQVPAQLRRWVKDRNPATGKLETVRGLVNRRNVEIGIWEEGSQDGPDLVAASFVDTGRIPTPPPAPAGVLGTSTGKAQAGALVTGGVAATLEVAKESFGDTLRSILDQIEPLSYLVDSMRYILVGGTLVLIAWTLWDRRRKLHEEGV